MFWTHPQLTQETYGKLTAVIKIMILVSFTNPLSRRVFILDSSLIGRKIKTNILVKVSHKNPYPDGFFINALFSSIQDAPRTGRARVNCDFLGSLHLASRLDSDQYLHVSRQRHQMSTLNLLLDIKHSLEHTYPYAKFPTSSLEGSYSFTAMIPVPEISNSVWSVNHHLSQIMRLSHNRSECF